MPRSEIIVGQCFQDCRICGAKTQLLRYEGISQYTYENKNRYSRILTMFRGIRNAIKKIRELFSVLFDRRDAYEPFSFKAMQIRDTLAYQRSETISSCPEIGVMY